MTPLVLLVFLVVMGGMKTACRPFNDSSEGDAYMDLTRQCLSGYDWEISGDFEQTDEGRLVVKSLSQQVSCDVSPGLRMRSAYPIASTHILTPTSHRFASPIPDNSSCGHGRFGTVRATGTRVATDPNACYIRVSFMIMCGTGSVWRPELDSYGPWVCPCGDDIIDHFPVYPNVSSQC